MDKNKTATDHAAFAYSVHLLRMLLKMQLISKEEYDRIVAIGAAYYGTELFLCLN